MFLAWFACFCSLLQLVLLIPSAVPTQDQEHFVIRPPLRAMEWTPSDKMTFTDLRAILASWDIPSISNDKAVLIKEVARHYRAIMLARANRRPVVPSFVSGLPSFTQGDDKSIGTDCPRTERSYIGSDETTRDEEELATSTPSCLDQSLIRDFEAALATCTAAYNKQREQADRAAPSDDQETHQVDDAGNVIGKKNEIPDETPVESAACAAAPPPPPPSLRRAVELEREATAKAKAAKAKKAVAKSKNKLLYGYLPMAGAFIDEDQKKDDGEHTV